MADTFKFVPARQEESPVDRSFLLKKKKIQSDFEILEKAIRIDACTELFCSLSPLLEKETSSSLLIPLTVVQKEPDDESLLPVIIPELIARFKPTANVIVLNETTNNLIRFVLGGFDVNRLNIIILPSQFITHLDQTDLIAYLLEDEKIQVHVIVDDSCNLLFMPIKLREHLVINKINYPSSLALYSLFLKQVFSTL
jgi:hypothetical protein